MEDGTLAVGLFNPGLQTATVAVEWAGLGLKGPQRVRDLWRQKDLGVFDRRFEAPVRPHGVVMVRAFPAGPH
jgi:alpha-galactosidase